MLERLNTTTCQTKTCSTRRARRVAALLAAAALLSLASGCQILDKKPKSGATGNKNSQSNSKTNTQSVITTPSGDRTVKTEPLAKGMDEVHRAKLLREQGLNEEALTQFMSAIEENPLLTTAYMGAGEILVEKGDLPAAEKNFGKAAELEPFNFNAQYWHARVLQDLQQFSKAI